MPKVLIVDDAAIMRYSLRKMLERNGFDVVAEAENGLQGIKRYMELKPDVVTMDLTMPELDGIGCIKGIKEIDPNAKIVVVSAMGQEPMVRDAVLAGAKGFIVKPFKEEHVVKTLKGFC